MVKLSSSYVSGIIYHDKFDYPLKENELVKWKSGKTIGASKEIDKKGEFYFLKGRKKIILRRNSNEKFSQNKLLRAKKVALFLSKIPSIRMIGLTGSLAMMNAGKLSDIDFMIITKKNTLWVTRALTLLTLRMFKIPTRRFNDKNEKDKICLNLWLDKSDLNWKERNIYTAHEIAQVIPLVDRDKTYEKFVKTNSWVKIYWPNAIRKTDLVNKKGLEFLVPLLTIFEPIAYFLQYLYMRKKITNEKISKSRAIFHPIDRSIKFDLVNFQ